MHISTFQYETNCIEYIRKVLQIYTLREYVSPIYSKPNLGTLVINYFTQQYCQHQLAAAFIYKRIHCPIASRRHVHRRARRGVGSSRTKAKRTHVHTTIQPHQIQGKLGWGLRKICLGLINITVPRVSLADLTVSFKNVAIICTTCGFDLKHVIFCKIIIFIFIFVIAYCTLDTCFIVY